ncbi:hypothetical protein QJS66_19660 [Kocuria rhizophila]|nr:hypothetical protein QJS66_19660 [Kocuria rhizophila]
MEITEVATARLAEVPWEHVLARARGTAVWPSGGRPTRSSARPRRLQACAEVPGHDMDDDTLVVLERFRLSRTR